MTMENTFTILSNALGVGYANLETGRTHKTKLLLTVKQVVTPETSTTTTLNDKNWLAFSNFTK